MTFDFMLYDDDDTVLALTDGSQVFVMASVTPNTSDAVGHLLNYLRATVEALHAVGCDVRRITMCNIKE
jgi:hypothetical protein